MVWLDRIEIDCCCLSKAMRSKDTFFLTLFQSMGGPFSPIRVGLMAAFRSNYG